MAKARRKQHAEDTGATAAQLQSVPHALNVKKERNNYKRHRRKQSGKAS
jgi:hypothetical protein